MDLTVLAKRQAVNFGPRPGAASDKDKHMSNPIQTEGPIVFCFC
jgi:hypothetical protein